MNDFTIYPGEYIPLPEVNAMQQMKFPAKRMIAQPPVNIDEFEHYFKIEIVIYGVSREEILLTVDENILSVSAACRDIDVHNVPQLHEFNRCCFNRVIQLPENTDPHFIIAEYKEGILAIYVPKSAVPLTKVHTRIVVY